MTSVNYSIELTGLLHKAGYLPYITIRELTDGTKHTYVSGYTLQQIKSEVEYSLQSSTDTEALMAAELDIINERIGEIDSFLKKKEFTPFGVLDSAELNYFLYYGFDTRRTKPDTTVETILQYMDEKHMLWPIVSLEQQVKELPIYDSKYFGKLYKELAVDELKFEMLEYIIHGGMYATWYEQLIKRRGELEDSGFVKDVAFATNEGVDTLGEPGKYFYHVMKVYFLKGCTQLKDLDMLKVLHDNPDAKLIYSKLNLKHREVSENNYRATSNTRNAKEFAKVYRKLQIEFKGSNSIAFKEVEIMYRQLKEDFPQLHL